MTNVANKAADIAYRAYGRAGVDGFYHACELARKVADDKRASTRHVAIAYLSGVLKDPTVTAIDLLEMGVAGDVVNGVKRLKRHYGESFIDYIIRVSEDPDASLVKLHDLEIVRGKVPVSNFDVGRRFYRSIDLMRKSIRRNCERRTI